MRRRERRYRPGGRPAHAETAEVVELALPEEGGVVGVTELEAAEQWGGDEGGGDEVLADEAAGIDEDGTFDAAAAGEQQVVLCISAGGDGEGWEAGEDLAALIG